MKATASYSRPTKPLTGVATISKTSTNTTALAKAGVSYQGNPDYEDTRTAYNDHVLYSAHIYYIGRDPDLIPGSTKNRTSSERTAKEVTNYTQ